MGNKLLKFFQLFTESYILIFTFLLPIKFASLAIMPETTAYFPEQLWEYIIVTFPASSFGIFTGVGLILACISSYHTLRFDKKHNYFLLMMWLVLAFVSLLGIINASTKDYIYLSLGHVFGVISYVLSVYLVINNNPKVVNRYFTVVTVSGIITLCVGIHQYFWGFDQQIEFYKQQAQDSVMLQQIEGKIYEKRITSTYGSCNAYAGYLLLIAGIMLIQLNKFSKHFEPVNVTKKIILSLTIISLVFVIINTGSRAAFASIVGSFIIMILLSKRGKKFKISLASTLVIIGVLGVVASKLTGRTFGSFTERVGYVRSSILMMWNNFFVGSGWGDFMVDNQKYRIIDLNEAARDPHNIFLTFGSQAGILALIIIMVCFLYPLYIFGRNYVKSRTLEAGILLFSLIAFIAHSMVEINYQIPSSFALAGAIFVILAYRQNEVESDKKLPKKQIFPFLLIHFSCSILAVMTIYLSVYNTICEKIFDDFLTKAEDLTYKYTKYEVDNAYLMIDTIKPYSPFHHNAMFQYYIRNNYDANMAQECIEKAIENSPERSGYYKALSNFYLQVRKDKVNAEKFEKKANELAPYTKKLTQ